MNTNSVYCVENMEHYPSAIINYPPYPFLCNFSYQRLRISSDFNIFLRTVNIFLVKIRNEAAETFTGNLCFK